MGTEYEPTGHSDILLLHFQNPISCHLYREDVPEFLGEAKWDVLANI